MNASVSIHSNRGQNGPTFCLLGASYNTGNRGVAALASGTINSVIHSFPDARIFLLDYDRQPRNHTVRCSMGTVDVELVNLRFSWRLWLKNNIARLLFTALALKLVPSQALRGRLISRNPYLKRIYESDVVGSIAGGDSFSDIYGLGRLFYVSLPQILVLVLGKPLLLLPQTLGPFRGVFGKALARYVLRRAAKVYTRDKESLVAVPQFLGVDSSKLRFSFDMAFALEPSPPSQADSAWLTESAGERPLIGFNPSGLLYLGGYTKDNMFGLKADYRVLIRDVILWFIEKKNCRVMLIPHAHKPGDTSESDTIACESLLRELGNRYPGRIHAAIGDHNEQEIKHLIGQCDFFLGSRMHACIAALSQCIPTVGLAYSRKFDGVLRSIGVDDLVVDLRAHDRKEILSLIEAVYDQSDTIRQRLMNTMPGVKASVLGLFSSLPNEKPWMGTSAVSSQTRMPSSSIVQLVK
jgi:colanic acid/amylovoran biosynthesis protein